VFRLRRNENISYLKDQRKDVVKFMYKLPEDLKSAKSIFVWDLDKTYLDTDFGGFRKIIKIALEKAVKKRNVPGADELVRMLAKSNDPFPIFFISASPPQMHDKIYKKWMHDKIIPYGFYSKDNLKNLRLNKLSRLTNHVGFKVQSLMELRLLISNEAKMICWGDDSESDANIYSVFSDICSHRLTDQEAKSLLKAFGVQEDQIELILELRDQKENFDPLSRVYINLAVDTDPEYYRRYGRRLLAVENTFEIAIDLFQRGFLKEDGVLSVAKSLITKYSFKPFQLEVAYNLLAKRSRLSDKADLILRPLLIKNGYFSPGFKPSVELVNCERLPVENDFESIVRPWIPERIDYLSDY